MNHAKMAKSAFIAMLAILFASSPAGALPKKKTHFATFVPVGPQLIKSGDFCGDLSGALSSDDFFEGLVRIQSGHNFEFRKNAQTVREFPSQISVALTGNIVPCGSPSTRGPVRFVQPGNESSREDVNSFMNGLKFTAAWQNPSGFEPVSSWKMAKSVPDEKPWQVSSRTPMNFAFQVPSQGVPITNQLVISVYAPSGARLCTFTAGVLSHVPKHRMKTIHGGGND